LFLAGTCPAWGTVFQYPVSVENPSETFTTVVNNLQSVEAFRARFTQTRKIQPLTRPLTSGGTMVFARDTGLYRHVTSPVEKKQFVSPDGTVVERLSGGEQRSMNLSGRPAGKLVTLTFNLFSGNIRNRPSAMSIYFRGSPSEWVLGLRPKKELSQFLREVSLTGHQRTIERMMMVHSNGDTTVTTFQTMTIVEELSSSERAIFRSFRRD
jgi:outer membrane lipoprotein-sorting protein